MATFKNGYSYGKLGKTTTYLLNGVLVTRLIGRSTKPPTELQQAVRLRAKLVSMLLFPVKEFIEVGYEREARRLNLLPQNSAFSYNWHAVVGEFPKLKIDFTKLRLSYGNMPPPVNLQVIASDEGLIFNWGQQEGVTGTHWSDQVMLLAYFPKLKKSAYMTAGASRYKGTDLLLVFDIEHGQFAETYIAFVSNDRKSISNSVYVGKVRW